MQGRVQPSRGLTPLSLKLMLTEHCSWSYFQSHGVCFATHLSDAANLGLFIQIYSNLFNFFSLGNFSFSDMTRVNFGNEF